MKRIDANTKKIIEDFRKITRRLEKKIEDLQTHKREKMSLKKKVSFTAAGLGIIGSGWTYALALIADVVAKYSFVSPVIYLQSVAGIGIGFFGYMLAHKGLEGTWL